MRAPENYRWFSSSIQLNTDMYMHVRKLPELGKEPPERVA